MYTALHGKSISQLRDVTCHMGLQPLMLHVHRVPKLATPLASNTLNSVWRKMDFNEIAHCTILTLLTVESKCTRWRSTMLMSCASVSRVQTAWDQLDQRIIDKAIKQWRTRLRAYVEAKDDHFEHKLWRLVQNDHLHECVTFCKNLSGINDFTPTYL